MNITSRAAHTAAAAPATLFLALFAILAALVLPPASAHALANEYGQLCAEFESGNDPACIDPNCAYGAYQMDTANAKKFYGWLKGQSDASYKKWGSALEKGYAADKKCGSTFDKAWKAAAKEDSAKFLKAQYAYVKKYYYDVAVKYWKQVASGFDDASYSMVLRNVIFSTAVQHGPYGSAYLVLKPAMDNIGGWKKNMAESKLVNAVYAERARAEDSVALQKRLRSEKGDAKLTVVKITGKLTAKNLADYKQYNALTAQYGLAGRTLTHFYSSGEAVQVGVYNRLAVREPSRAAELYKAYTGKSMTVTAQALSLVTAATCKHAHTKGGKVTKYSALTDRDHKEKVSALYCKDCGKKLAKATTRTVKNKFKLKGANYKDVSGRSYTVHDKGWYKAAGTLNVRKSRSASSAVKATVKKKALLKVSSVKMGSDGFWWGKVKAGGKTGYVRMCNLKKLGTGAGVHKYNAKGVCAYCGKTRAQVANAERIAAKVKKSGELTCTFTSKGTVYKCAYTQSKALEKRKKGETVRITAVYKNLYYIWWGKTSDGRYVPLHVLQ